MTNYFKSTLRNLWKNRGYSSLNIAGLAVGVACASLIFLWVEDEVTFDHDVAKREHIYKVMGNQIHNGVAFTGSNLPGPMAAVLVDEVAGIKAASRITEDPGSAFITADNKSFYETGQYVDSTFLSIITPQLLRGSAETALNDLYSLVITERMAMKFFGTTDVLGKTVTLDRDKLFTITAVIENPRSNSSFRADWFARYELLEAKAPWLTRWDALAATTIVELYPDADLNSINEKLTKVYTDRNAGSTSKYFVFPMSDWHLYYSFSNGQPDGQGQIKYVRLFTIIACIILLVACINFMNLATARSEQRVKEVGVRKTLGAGRRVLISQFLAESLTLAFVSVLIAIAIVYFTMPSFNSLVGKELTMRLNDWTHVVALVTVTLVCGLLAGSYPAFYLSSFNPVQVLKGVKIKASSGSGFVRKGLVVVQFMVSVTLMIATVIIYQQISFTKGRDVGYSTQQSIYIRMQGDVRKNFNAIKTELIRKGVAENAAMSISPVFRFGWYDSNDYTWQGKDPNESVSVLVETVTPEYISTVGMNLKEGRDFNPDVTTDVNNIIINEAFARLISDRSAVGEEVVRGDHHMKVIGVVKDFVSGNVYRKSASPIMLITHPDVSGFLRFLTIRLNNTTDIQSDLEEIGKVMKEYNPEYPFEYNFTDAEFDKLFKTEALAQNLAAVFGALAVFISCLGLFGLASYTTQRRSKEIGIRKILGASVNNITSMISSDFLKLIAFSFVVAFPISWYMMNNWLQTYEYRTPIYWWVFGGVGLITLACTMLTVGFQTLKAALRNPTEVLRSE
ncbi:MAG TPA: ABC transporter permease [Cyclobacteriaceae bacterium]|nr:ABC transporter permease [Cyclobacteriaceae bacterium]